MRALEEVADEIENHTQRILALEPHALLVQRMHSGTERRGGGVYERPFLLLLAAGSDGRLASAEWFDADREAEAIARFEALAGDSDAAHPLAAAWLAGYLRAFAERDWDAMTALFSPDLVSRNHRLVGWGTRYGPAGVISTMQAQFELAPDTQARVDHVRTCERGLIVEYAWYGTREGGPFENLWIDVFELDERGRARRCDVWEPGQVEQARSRFADIETGATPPQRFANAATRRAERVGAALEDRDFERFAAGFAADFRNVDRRAHLESGQEEWLAAFRQMVKLTGRLGFEVVATRDERWALVRFHWEGAGGDIGPSEMDWLVLIEVDERGNRRLGVTFDPVDLDAALAELDERYAAGETAAPAAAWRHLRAALEQHDWDAIADLCAPGLVAQDHWLVGFGTRSGQTTVRQAQRALIELAPDARIRTRHLRTASRGFLSASMWVGTRDGGPFEIPILEVIEVDGHGRVARLDLYDPQHLDAALARFEQIGRGAVPDPLGATARPNEEPQDPSKDA